MDDLDRELTILITDVGDLQTEFTFISGDSATAPFTRVSGDMITGTIEYPVVGW